jgi:aspartate aminotransferase-like enzyme
MKRGRHAVYYFDLIAAVEKAQSGDTPYTPAISLVFALQRALEMIREEGIDRVIARHAANAGAVRAAVGAMRLGLFASVPSNATTAVVVPDGRAGDVTRRMEHTYGVKIAGGQARLKGRIIRLGHLGYYYPTDMYTLISALEATLCDLGMAGAFGRGVEALQRSYAGGGE